MKRQLLITIFLILLATGPAFSQTSWYVSKQNGSDSNNGLSPSDPFRTAEYAVEFLEPGDTLFIMDEYANDSYDPNYTFDGDINDPHIWLSENSIKISNLNGTPDHYITLKPYDENTVIKGDGANIIRITSCSYLQIEGLDIYGEVENIPLSTALALQFLYIDPETGEVVYRVPPGTPDEEVAEMTFPILGSVTRPSYTNTRGLYISDVDHINIVNNTIHHLPGGGLRVAECEHINITENTIHDCSRKSYAGTHALVVTKARSSDSSDDYKINILSNEVYYNYNEIYSWSPQKSFINPRIDEGKGISLQRNNADNWTHGRFLVANNVCYWNGFSGVHTNSGKRIDFINNTCYFNSYTNTVTYADEEQMGSNIGISAQSSEDIRIINNISYVDNTWGGHPISVGNTTNFTVSDNMIYGDNGPVNQDPDVVPVQVNTTIADPLFTDSENYDFHLQQGSPAIGLADPAYAPVDDFYGYPRDSDPDLGAIEYDSTTGVTDLEGTPHVVVYPNPFTDILTISGKEKINVLEIYTMAGQCIYKKVNMVDNYRLQLAFLKKGMYILRLDNSFIKVAKK